MFRTPYQDLDMLHSRAIGAIRAAVQAAEARVRKECGGDIRAAALHILERRAEKAEADLARLQGLRGRKDGEARPHACPICMGQGFVYDMACTAPQKPCPACNGARVLWGPPA
jgi:rubrerythrin